MLVHALNTLLESLERTTVMVGFLCPSEELTRTKEPGLDPYHITYIACNVVVRSKYHTVMIPKTKSKIPK